MSDKSEQKEETEDERVEREEAEQAALANASPRRKIQAEIEALADSRSEEESKERFPTSDEDGNLEEGEETEEGEDEGKSTEEEKTSEENKEEEKNLLDPDAEYEVEIDGQKVLVKGARIFDAGRRTLQKEGAADVRLELANRLLAEAEARARGGRLPNEEEQKGEEEKDVDLKAIVKSIQLGSEEEAVKALESVMKSARKGTVTADQLERVVAGPLMAQITDHIERREARAYAESEYGDILKNPFVQRLFLVEERRRRAPRDQGGEADQRPHRELYKSIGEDLRKSLNMPKPTGTDQRSGATSGKEASTDKKVKKAAGAQVPRSAASRLGAGSGAKEETVTDILNDVRKGRHQPLH